MDTQIIVHLDKTTLDLAEKLATQKGITVSDLTGLLICEAANKELEFLKKFPVADWVLQLGEGEPEYKPRTRKEIKEEYFESRR